MTARVETTVDLDVGTDLSEDWASLAARRPAVLAELPLDEGQGMRIRFGVDLGAVAETAEVIVPFAAVADFVDRVRAGQRDGFRDALDRLPPQASTPEYLDAHSLGVTEAIARAE